MRCISIAAADAWVLQHQIICSNNADQLYNLRHIDIIGLMQVHVSHAILTYTI